MSAAQSREGSASPKRDEAPPPKKPKSTGGFKWKEKHPRHEEPSPRDRGYLERGYRERSPNRNDNRYDRNDRYRSRDYPERSDRFDARDSGMRRDNRNDNYRQQRDRDGDRWSRPGGREDFRPRSGVDQRDSRAKDSAGPSSKPKDKSATAPAPAAPSGEAMIIVNINDRLGTKAAIPCFASDSVKAFKAMVAAHIGRQPHEIMLKRQGERPFKDQLSLEDYGVSNGVQLDLELDTGD